MDSILRYLDFILLRGVVLRQFNNLIEDFADLFLIVKRAREVAKNHGERITENPRKNGCNIANKYLSLTNTYFEEWDKKLRFHRQYSCFI